MFTLYPAMDLIQGRCVRLAQGDFARRSDYAASPQGLAAAYREAGAEWLHVVDLDAAKSGGQEHQLACLGTLAQACGLRLQIGGGIHSQRRLEQILELGAARVVVGSLCVQKPRQVQDWLEQFGPERIVLALDLRYRSGLPYIAIHGWQQDSLVTLWELLQQFPSARHILCTDIGRDGMLRGSNLDLYTELAQRYPHVQIQASGGIASLQDLLCLQAARAAGAVVGKALLEGRFTLQEALQQAASQDALQHHSG